MPLFPPVIAAHARHLRRHTVPHNDKPCSCTHRLTPRMLSPYASLWICGARQGFAGPKEQLGKAEQFFLAIAAVPRYKIRTKCMQVRSSFTDRSGELHVRIEDVAAAVKEVRTSKALRIVLEHTLALGNYLNGGTNKGAAWGFKLESLNKLIGTKTLDNKSTLLHYLARKLATVDAVDRLIDELAHVEGAARIVWKDEVAELAGITTSLKQVETQVKLDKNESFTASMGAFHVKAKATLEKMTKLKEETDKAANELLKWFGEDAKVQPEELFSTLNNFMLTLEKGHRYNLECVMRAAQNSHCTVPRACALKCDVDDPIHSHSRHQGCVHGYSCLSATHSGARSPIPASHAASDVTH